MSAGKHRPPECYARVTAPNEDGNLVCDLMADHLGLHYDPEYGEWFSTPGTTAH